MRPERPKAVMGFLGMGQPAPSPSVRGSGGALQAPPAGSGGARPPNEF